ncbi:MAG: (deoxy)nucleoside triphosphate pyrophosphohydrolase [Bacteroidaceae bacterium]|nr:(deoxy)nucleoside triphosphate pyrophosphohydrolase [Bacteroidaceae bacterium]
MKTINVVAAIIVREGKVFATQRGYGEWKDWWEFPGGKIEPGEDPKDALRREIMEELATEIVVGERLITVEHDYPKFHLSMQCFVCSVVSGKLTLLEHEAAKWLAAEELDSVRWLPADEGIITKVREIVQGD